jgi:hypothetical protein
MLGHDTTLRPQLLYGLPRCHACDAVVPRQVRFGRKPITRPQLTAIDRGTQVISDLPVRRPIVAPIDPPELHPNSFSRPDNQ